MTKRDACWYIADALSSKTRPRPTPPSLSGVTLGNILSVATTQNGETSTKAYTYGNADWKDLLTAYDGQTITYDAIGNPLSYYNGQNWTFTWTEGRRLATAVSGETSVSYAYDADGYRTSKTVNGVTHNYTYLGGKLVKETWGENELTFAYDESGRPFSLTYNDTTYYYVLNLQGDVVRIVDSTGVTQASYTYDAWGNLLNTVGEGIGAVNPLRYRGYVWDEETGLYYLNSRYYDPVVKRFINADGYMSTGQGVSGHNMFVYCYNNASALVDRSGAEPEEAFDTDGDGTTDCYIYTYTYETGFLWDSSTEIGTVYIYTNISTEEEFESLPKPDGFNESSDLLVGDWIDRKNPTIYAYQAQKLSERNRSKVVDIFFEYTGDLGKKWNRTKASVLVEWKEHHRYALFSKRAQNIDFDEKEEGKGFLYFLGKAISAALT